LCWFFCAAALVGFALEGVPWVDTNMVTPIIAGQAWLAGVLIHVFGGLAEVSHVIIRHPVNQFAIQIANGCSGIEAGILLAAAPISQSALISLAMVTLPPKKRLTSY
jgi:hypothetical protein